MNSETLPIPSQNNDAEAGVEKRREVAEEIKKLFESATEAATKLIHEQGGVVIRDKIVPLEEGQEGADLWFTETHLILEALEQKKSAAEERGDLEGRESAQQYALAQDFFEHYHGSVAAYLDALKKYPETANLMEHVHPDLPGKLVEAQQSYDH